jgi:uncharacterized protein (TIGR01777 family)
VAFAWHARPGAFERLVPPWERVRVVERRGGLADGRVVLEVRQGPLRLRWVAVHRDYEEGRRFTDEQVEGPFARWVHTHGFRADGPDASWLEDVVDCRLPLGPAGEALGGGLVRRRLERLLRFRHARLREDLRRHRAAGARALRVVVSGASGLVGSALVPFLTTGGHRVDRLVRGRPAGPGEVAWDPAAGGVDAAALEGADAVVHLAGASLAAGRWTPARKRAIVESRTVSTGLLAAALARLRRPPRVLVSASAVGFYGDRGDEALDEASAPGTGFLAETCRAWEAAADPARQAGIRVVHPRLGVVLAGAGGALARLVWPFRLGLGGPVGSGRQVMSWIALDDVVGALHHCLLDERLEGAVNLTAPQPVSNRELGRAVGRVLRRPAVLPLPAAAVRVLFGEMGEALLLAGQRVLPGRLRETGFRFLQPEVEAALRAELGR